jgi:hypothetical protein
MSAEKYKSPLHRMVSTTFRNRMHWSEFLGGYQELAAAVRDFMLPDPDNGQGNGEGASNNIP